MEKKINWLIFFKKRFTFLFSVSILFFAFFSIHSNFLTLSFSFLEFFKDLVYCMDLNFCLDQESLLFSFIVFLVTRLVILYREFYIEHYNIKKFAFLTFSFFFSMILLCSRNSFNNFLVGWDGLGISSLCLIIFYPNKRTIFNSYLTFFFNRLGDICILCFLGFVYCRGNLNLFLFEKFNLIFIILILICSFTKGAQFPLSSWLPAAISAPTPISAMVHSSTLVTAGIFILWKINYFLAYFHLLWFVVAVSLRTFLIGGFLANFEIDLKKVVAFSTLRQISIITFFLGVSMLNLSLFHIFNHALFKTMIFCCCGIVFLFSSGDQNFFNLSNLSKNFIPRLALRIFGITGYIFSSSFFTKDMVIEILFLGRTGVLGLIIIAGRIFTILYCTRILNRILNSKFYLTIFYSSLKEFIPVFIILFSTFILVFRVLISKIFTLSTIPVIDTFTLVLIFTLLLGPIIINSPHYPGYFYPLNLDLFFIKFFSFSFGNKFLLLDQNDFISRDQLFFKPFLGLKIYSELDKKNFFFFIILLSLALKI